MFFRVDKTRSLTYLFSIATFSLLSGSFWNLSSYTICRQKPKLCACHRCLTEDDPWIRKRIKESPPVFLSRDYQTSEETFNWWKRMQFERRNFAIYKTAVDKIFEIIPPSPDVVQPGPDRCRTCAVVGNSGNLKGSHYGPLIDFHDFIIRMNHGQTEGYEADVGSRTTHHVMYPTSAVNVDNDTHLVLFAFKISDFEWLYKDLTPKDKAAVSRANKDLVMILNPALIKYVHEVWLSKKGRYPSTGFLTLAMSMLICDEISVFGFGADRDGNWNHYYETLTNKKLKTGQHPGKQEYEMIEELHERQIIRFYKGW